ncbi:helix-turn-helix transcriptional regulator [Nonomuraea typhae]|uniref:helix-turn-helix transcriptional regulator n=1 Tax=Nonomuraea typhae TaxID=2603600 RepID=UPI0012FA45E7|nr:helix-turn-helix transcriptional regulator [Nonomuraea typhae]
MDDRLLDPHRLILPLYHARDSRGWTQEKIEDTAGINRRTVSEAESGTAWPKLNPLIWWAGALDHHLTAITRQGRHTVTDMRMLAYLLYLERDSRGWSRTTTAKTAGVSPERLTVWEDGQHDPQLRKLLRWAAALDTRLAIEPARRPS